MPLLQSGRQFHAIAKCPFITRLKICLLISAPFWVWKYLMKFQLRLTRKTMDHDRPLRMCLTINGCWDRMGGGGGVWERVKSLCVTLNLGPTSVGQADSCSHYHFCGLQQETWTVKFDIIHDVHFVYSHSRIPTNARNAKNYTSQDCSFPQVSAIHRHLQGFKYKWIFVCN
jgi:hypothetical protein